MSCTILRKFYSMSDKYSQVTQERSSYKCSMKEHAIALVTNPKKSSLSGFALNDQDMTSKQLRARITAILGIQSYDESVTSIDFTRDAETRVSTLKLQLWRCSSGYQKPFRHPAILLMIANRLIQTGKGSSMPIIDLFPEQYTTIPDILVSSSCAYVGPCVSNISGTLTSRSDRLCSTCLIPRLLWGFPYEHDPQGGTRANTTFKTFS